MTLPPVIGKEATPSLLISALADGAGGDLELGQCVDEARVERDLGVDAGEVVDLGDRLDVLG